MAGDLRCLGEGQILRFAQDDWVGALRIGLGRQAGGAEDDGVTLAALFKRIDVTT